MTGRFPEPDQIFEDKYRVERLLGSGGFARVYLAEQVDLGRKVAIKILSLRVRPGAGPESSQEDAELESIALRFEREARIISQLNSAQTITIYDYGRTPDGLLYMVMEYVDGEELGQIPVPIAPRRALKILRQVLQSLHEAHARELLHRDLKPANIMVYEHFGQKDQVKLLDFGIAKAIGDVANGAGADLTATDSLIGTPRYMSPEQIRGKDMGPASDIYSLGLVAYELLMGTKAITNNDSIEILGAHLAADSFQIPRDDLFHPALCQLINKMLYKDLELRYRSASEVLEDLAQVEKLDGDLRMSGPPTAILQGVPADESSIEVLDESFIETLDGLEMIPEAEEGGSKRAGLLVLVALLVLGGAVAVVWINSAPSDTVEAVEQIRDHGQAPQTPDDAESPGANTVMTVIRTQPLKASIYFGDRLVGMSPVQFTSEEYAFPLTVRAEYAGQEVERVLEKPGGDILIEIATPEDAGDARAKMAPDVDLSNTSAKNAASQALGSPARDKKEDAQKAAPKKPKKTASKKTPSATRKSPNKAPAKRSADPAEEQDEDSKTLKYLPLE